MRSRVCLKVWRRGRSSTTRNNCARGNVRRPAGTRQDGGPVRFEVPYYRVPDAGAASTNLRCENAVRDTPPVPNEWKPGRRKARGSAQPTLTVPALPIAVPALRMSIPVSRNFKREDVEQALGALHVCVVNHRVDDAGEDAYQNLSDWLRKGRAPKPCSSGWGT